MSKNPIQNILAPVDFSKASIASARYVCNLAQQLKATVHLLHAVEINSLVLSYERYSSQLGNLEYEIRKKAQAQLDELLTKLPSAEVSIEPMIVTGIAAEVICEAAKNVNADLIVMARHGSKDLSQLLIGSVTNKVLHATHIPVVVLNPETKGIEALKSTLI